MKRATLAFFSGALVTWLLLSFVFAGKSSGEMRSKGDDASVFGVHHSFGEEARALATVAGVKIPPDAIDCFYSIGGLKPAEFVAFTVSKDRLWPCVAALTGRTKSESRALLHGGGPDMFGEECRTILYDLSRISAPVAIDWKLKGDRSAECVIDEVAGRVFVFLPSK